MRFLLTTLALFVLSLSLNLKAQETKFSYQVNQTNQSPFNLKLYELSKSFEERNFIRFSKSPSGKIPFVHVDEVLFSPGDNRLIFISTQIIAPLNLQYKIIEGKNLVLYHTDEASIAFFNFKPLEVRELTASLNMKTSVKFSPFDFFINSASASSELDCQKNSKDNLRSLKTFDKNISNSLITQKINECLVNAFQGMKNEMTSSFDFFVKLKDDPWLLWEEVKKSFSELSQLAQNFSSEMKSLFESLSHLDINLKLEIACQASGELAFSAATMLTGAGLTAGASKLVMTFLPKLNRLKRLLEQTRIFKLPAQVAKDSLSCGI